MSSLDEISFKLGQIHADVAELRRSGDRQDESLAKLTRDMHELKTVAEDVKVLKPKVEGHEKMMQRGLGMVAGASMIVTLLATTALEFVKNWWRHA